MARQIFVFMIVSGVRLFTSEKSLINIGSIDTNDVSKFALSNSAPSSVMGFMMIIKKNYSLR